MDKIWGFTLSRDESVVLSVGLSPDVTTPLMETPVGRLIALFPNKASALLYARAVVLSGYFEPGEYTFYEIHELPADSFVQEVKIEFDDKRLGYVSTVAVSPPLVPPEFICFAERRTILTSDTY